MSDPTTIDKPVRQSVQFMEQWTPVLKDISSEAELDFSFRNDAVMIVDMSIPSAQRQGVLYTREAIENGLDKKPGDFERRVREFLRR